MVGGAGAGGTETREGGARKKGGLVVETSGRRRVPGSKRARRMLSDWPRGAAWGCAIISPMPAECFARAPGGLAAFGKREC